MERVAVFVDAGHYFAAAARLAFGHLVPRRELQCDHSAFVAKLLEQVQSHFGNDTDVRVLRVYWYDGAPNAVPSPRQLEVARLSNVKLRLGRITGGEQKGVDGLIILDLLTLARERALDTAFLLSGDEDLREAVAAAQQVGVRVVLLGIPPRGQRGNQAESLIREVDHHDVLHEDFWCPFLSRIPVEPTPPVPTEPTQPPTLAEAASPIEGAVPVPQPWPEERTEATAKEFFEQWAEGATPGELVKVGDARPRIPGALDAALLEFAWERNKRSSLDEETRRRVRKGFWKAFDERSPDQSELPAATPSESQPAD
jgi:uncharacterized LabA/DUF88 family protein